MDSVSERPITTEEILQISLKKIQDVESILMSSSKLEKQVISISLFKLFQSVGGKWWMSFMHPNGFYKVHVLLTLKSDKDKCPPYWPSWW